MKKRHLLPLAILLGGLLLSSCSPEYTRVRGGGMGGDVGNRQLGPSMGIHGPVDSQFGQPIIGRASELEQRR